MAIETKELLKFLNLGFAETDIEALDLEKVKEKFTSVYSPKSELNQKTGEMIGRLGTKYKQILQAQGIDFVNSDVDGKPFEEVMELGITKFKTKFSTEIEDLKSKVGTGTGKQDEALLKKIEKLEQKDGEWSGKYSALQTEYDGFKTDSESKFKNYKLQNKLNEIHSNKIQWKQDTSDLTKKGYFSTINENYKVELDENDNILVKDKTGNQIPNPAVNNTFMKYEDILQEVGVKEGTWPLNNHVQRQPAFVATPTTPAPAVQPQAQGSRERVLNLAGRK